MRLFRCSRRTSLIVYAVAMKVRTVTPMLMIKITRRLSRMTSRYRIMPTPAGMKKNSRFDRKN